MSREMTEAELLSKFFSNSCSPEEAETAISLLEAEPALVERYLDWREWRHTDADTELPEHIKETLEKNVIFNTKPAGRIVRMARLGTAAAVTAGLLLSGYHFLYYENKFISTKSTHAQEARKVVKNSTDHDLGYKLPDGSKVVLSGGSIISFSRHFSPFQRNIRLEGKGLFSVRKDKQRPFTVSAQEVKTTALGTKFVVSTNETNKVKVELLEGSVKVDMNAVIPLSKEVILRPGQNCVVDLLLRRSVTASNDRIAKQEHAAGHKTAEQYRAVNLDFAGSPLILVLNALNTQFNDRIQFDRASVDGVYFTGKILRTDSLALTLEIICKMNDLKLRKSKSGNKEMYFIRK